MASSAGPDDASGGPVPPDIKSRRRRIAALGVSVLVTGTAVLGGIGVLPDGGTKTQAAPQPSRGDDAAAASLAGARQRLEAAETITEDSQDAATELSSDEPDPDELLVPEDSGEGRRVVFDQSAQRVWLVRSDGSAERTYLVSGSVYDNLDPGTYSVFSRDKLAWGVDGSELRYMVRFTTGAEAAIGFHNIPVVEGKKVQTPDELGTPLSDDSIRQWGKDAQALWEFAPLGTTVVVVA